MDFSVFKNKYFIEGDLVVLTALHIGSGKEEAEHDAPFIKEDGNFYIPGSSFRGYLRTKLERFLLDENNFKFKDKKTQDLLNMADVLLLFGYTNLFTDNTADIIKRVQEKMDFTDKEKDSFSSVAGRIHIADMPITSDVNSVRRDGIKIDRNTGATEVSAKFDYDIIPAGSKFKFTIELENVEPYQLDLIALALKDICDEGDLFGGKLSRGIGKCKLEDLKIQYVDKNNLKKYIFEKKKSDMDKNNFFKFANLELVD
ncbi:RAMP superfamily CRISPR-associated protein [Fusobacterium polymorphum]|uniref:RAMP superfamily CRISPR-associated protein n=1 Tax=Fusobacterium nucleatum subsp. polymorphum TaxID=76857 RepID=UPI0030CF33E3